jgi:hypothetical protein
MSSGILRCTQASNRLCTGQAGDDVRVGSADPVTVALLSDMNLQHSANEHGRRWPRPELAAGEGLSARARFSRRLLARRLPVGAAGKDLQSPLWTFSSSRPAPCTPATTRAGSQRRSPRPGDTGGAARPQPSELIGPIAGEMLASVALDVAILGVDAINWSTGRARTTMARLQSTAVWPRERADSSSLPTPRRSVGAPSPESVRSGK